MTREEYLEKLKQELKNEEELLNGVVIIDTPMIEKRIEELKNLIILFQPNEI